MSVPTARRIATGDSRKLARYRVTAPVTFKWLQHGERGEAEGITRDLSATSLFAWTQTVLPSGVELHCEVLLPRMNPEAQPVKVEMKGWVRRVERRTRQHNLSGFAITTNRTSVLTPEGTSFELKGTGVNNNQHHN